MPTFIGDIHAQWGRYNKIIRSLSGPSLQVGDFGIGFEHEADEMYDIDLMRRGHHYFGRGNHDNLEMCKNTPMYMPDGSITEDGVFWVGGAMSADKQHRIEGKDWWRNEELSMGDIYDIMNKYDVSGTDILAAHCAPDMLTSHFPKDAINRVDTSRTRQALDSLIEIRKPKVFVCGHEHFSFDHVIDGIRFVIIPIDGVVTI